MNVFNSSQLFVIISCLLLSLGFGVIWLSYSQSKLKHKYNDLLEQVSSISTDMSGLCLAAVQVDARLAENTNQLNEVAERIDNYAGDDIVSSAYQSVIDKVQEGFSEQDIIKECGLSREEAALLIKLHG